MEQRYKFYASAEECADAAAPKFRRCKWYWKRHTNQIRGYIPSRDEIRDELLHLAEMSRDNEGREAEAGRLIAVGGRFGYLDPVNGSTANIDHAINGDAVKE